MRQVPPGGGIVLALAVMVPFWIGVVACAWTPRQMVYPDGMKIIQVDQHTLDSVCSSIADDGHRLRRMDGEHPVGCYDKSADTIYLLDSCEGAEALPHELAHRENVAEPSRSGFDW